MAASLIIAPPAIGYAVGTGDPGHTTVVQKGDNDNVDDGFNDNVAPADVGIDSSTGGEANPTSHDPNNSDGPGNGGDSGGGSNDQSSPGSY